MGIAEQQLDRMNAEAEEAIAIEDEEVLPDGLAAALPDLRARYGSIFVIRQPAVRAYGAKKPPPDDVIVVRSPDVADVETLMVKLMGGNAQEKAKAISSLTKKVVVWPAAADFAAMTASRPGLLISFSNKVQEIAGLSEGTILAKL